MRKTITLAGICLGLLALLGCRQIDVDQEPAADTPSASSLTATVTPELASGGETRPAPQLSIAPEATADTQPVANEAASYGYTHQRADGNRLVAGRGALPEATVIDIPLAGRPAWVVGAPVPDPPSQGATGAASIWVVVMDDGRVQAFTVDDGQVAETAIEPSNLGDLPPLLQVTGGRPALLTAPSPVSGHSPPALLDESGTLALISPEGVLTIVDHQGASLATTESLPLPDARLLTDGEGRLLFLSQPTTRYDHRIAGDDVEAAAVTLFDSQATDGGEVVIPVPEPAVIEGIMPLWADLNGDGRREVIVTQSDAQNGAQIVAYDENGELVAIGPAIGQGYRWRHQLVVAPFGPNGEMELVNVRTPHIGGVVEFYQMVGDELQIMAREPGFTSHVIGSRNLDMALAGDVDGDGIIEVLLPNQARTELGAIRRTADGAEVAWTAPLEGVLSSNLAAATLADGRMIVGAGRDDGKLRLWAP